MRNTELILVRVTPKEKALFGKLAEYKDLTLSALVREALHNLARRNKGKLK